MTRRADARQPIGPLGIMTAPVEVKASPSVTDRSRSANPLLTISEVIAEIGVPRATFYRWRQLRKGPRSIKLPNGDVRIRRSELDRWLASLEEGAV
jgi:predicted DNA-binding transcriptional regulator AlpA